MALRRSNRGRAEEFVRLGRPGAAPGPRKVALVPGAEVPLLSLDLPAGLRGQAREQVARRQLKDRLGLGAEALVMRPFAPDGGENWGRVLVAQPDRLADWRGVACRAVLPDYLALPAAAGVWTIACESGSVLARLGPGDGFSAAPAVAAAMLRAALASGAPKAVLRIGDPAPEIDAVLAGLDVPVASRAEETAHHGLPLPARLQHGELALDLRRDPEAARARLRRRVLPWRWPYLLACCAALLWAAGQIMAIRDAEARTETVDGATRALVVQHFVPQGRVLEIRTQVARALAEARTAGADNTAEAKPLDIFGRAADVIAARHDAATELVTFARPDGLTLILRLKDFAAADALSEALQNAGLAVERGDTRVSEAREGVRAEFRIAPGGEADR